MRERRPTISVDRRPDGRWAVQKVGSMRASWVMDTKDEAVARALEKARVEQAQLVISEETAASRREGRSKFWMWLVGLAVPLAATVAIALWQDSRPDSPEERVAACRKDHDAPIAGDREDASYVWADCSWPPAPGAEEDGFFEITHTIHGIPGTSMADEYTHVDVFETACKRVSLQYHFENQGTSVDEDPLVLNMDQIVSGYDGTPARVPPALVSKIGGSPLGRLFVVFHGRYFLKDVHCVQPPKDQ